MPLPNLRDWRQNYTTTYTLYAGPNFGEYYRWSLIESYVYGFEPGTYDLTITYDTEKFSKNYTEIWNGKINAPKITFSVKEPSLEQKNAYELLKSANRIIIGFERDKYPQARNLLLKLLKNEPNSG